MGKSSAPASQKKKLGGGAASKGSSSSDSKVTSSKGTPTRTAKKAESTATLAQRLAQAPQDALMSNDAAEGANNTTDIRGALSSLYSVSTKMHRPGRFEHPVKSLLTGVSSTSAPAAANTATPSSGITSEQIWGQLNTLSMPVINEAQKNLFKLQKQLDGDDDESSTNKNPFVGKNKKGSVPSKSTQALREARLKKVFAEEEFENDLAGNNNVDHLDAELEAIDSKLAKQYRNQKEGKGGSGGKAQKKEGDWRYAFGGGTDEPDSEDEEGGDEDEKIDYMMGLGGQKKRQRGRTIGEEDNNDQNKNQSGGYDDDEGEGDDEEDIDFDDDDDIEYDEDDDEEEISAADRKKLLQAQRNENRGGEDEDEDDIDFDAEPEDIFGGEDDEDNLNNEDRAVMAELYGTGADDTEFMDEDNDEIDNEYGMDDFGKLNSQQKRKKNGDDEDNLDEDDEDFTDDEFDDDLASREEGEEFDDDEDNQPRGARNKLLAKQQQEQQQKKKKKITFGDNIDDADDQEAENYDDDLEGYGEGLNEEEGLTEYEKNEMARKQEIKEMEEGRLFNTDWAMGGEVSASKRPRDSLIEEVVDFDHAMKSVPVVTEHMTMSIEERIKKRIVDNSFDDVVRKTRMTTADDLVTTKKDNALESEKSKLSLMDLYEKDYLEKMKAAEAAQGGPEAAEPLTEIEKDELKAVQMWKRINQHLDALSNFFFTPKPTQGDLDARVRAVSDAAPAITLENVGNAAINREAAVAPQDLYRPKDNRRLAGVSVDEMDPREKRAMRRSHKEGAEKTKERRVKQSAKNTVVKTNRKAAEAEAKTRSA